MKALEVFSFVKAFKCSFGDEWTFVDQITSIDVMPMLRQMSFCIVVNANDLVRMNHSALFTDSRHVDVRFAAVIDDDRSHVELRSYVQRYFASMASATFISQSWPGGQPFNTPSQFYASVSHRSLERSNVYFNFVIFSRRKAEVINIYSTLSHGISSFICSR